jgi:hypothetical protein
MRWRNPQSLGPERIYRDVSNLLYFRPDMWRKVARMLCKARDIGNIICSMGDPLKRREEYLQSSMRDTHLPEWLKWHLRLAIEREFEIVVDFPFKNCKMSRR